MTTSTEDWLMTPQDAADRLGVSMSTINRLARNGHVRYVKIGRAVRISRRSIDALVAGGVESTR